MKRISMCVAIAMAAACYVLTAPPANAQTASSGSLVGQVSDPQGAIVAGADIALTDTTTKGTLSTTTNEAGRYNFPVVHPGVYDLVVTKTGFKTAKFSGQRVSVGSVLTLNVSLEVGALTETVVVTAGAGGTELQTVNATVGTTINLKDLELLPNLGRDATTLMALQPGVTPAGSVAGAVSDQNSFTVDGGQNSDDMSGDQVGYTVNFTGNSPTNGGNQINGMASGVAPTPLESVEEFRVNTFGQTADFNGSIGAQVQMVTRRGSDQWHGSAYGYYWTPNILGANSWKANHTPFTKGSPATPRACAAGTTLHTGDNNCIMPYTPIIPNQRKRFGFTIGGTLIPWEILGGKTYVFANYEGFRFGGVQTFRRAYPTAAMRAGVIQVQNATTSAISGTENGASVSYAPGAFVPYNLNPFPVTVTVGNPNSTLSPLRTVTLLPCLRTTTLVCDPRANAANATPNPLITQLWNTIPLPNDPLTGGDQFNTQGYLSTIRLPLTSDVYVGRIDHDFGPNHRFFTSFRAQHLERTVNSQVDVGGLLSGTTRGQYSSTAVRVQTPELLVFGLTSTLGPTLTNDLRLSYLWNWWGWGTAGIPPQLPSLGGALEIADPTNTDAETSGTAALIPYNVDTQDVRQRTWDGKDYMIRDDVSWVHGNHLIQFGGFFQPNVDYFARTDNGTTISNQIVYQIASKSIGFTGFYPVGVTNSTMQTSFGNLATAVYGLDGFNQVLYTREGANLAIQPLGKQSQVQSTIKTYNAYVNDTWRISPSLTLSLGVGYTVETPPVEQEGRQVVLVDNNGKPIRAGEFLEARRAAALNGQAYAPVVGFETARNLNLKHPYEPFYGGISPKFSVAWNPQFKSGILHRVFGEGETVFRAGYGRQFGRLNGVNNLLVPMSGPGLLQSVTCDTARIGDLQCLNTTPVDVSTVFRIGRDGLTAPLPSPTGNLPQPFFPGALQTGTTAVPCPLGSTLCNPRGGDSRAVDFAYRPESTDNFDFTIQRSFGRKMSIEVGYMGRKIDHEFAEVDLDSVPYMMTRGGQTFAQAWAALWTGLCAPGGGGACTQLGATNSTTLPALLVSIPAQPFFENVLGGPTSTYCTGFANCTQALLNQSGARGFISTVRVSDFWAYLNTTGNARNCTGAAGCVAGTLGSWALGRTMLSDQATTIGLKTALGFGNYNAAFFTMRVHDWHGITAVTNFTWGRSLGLGANTQRSSGTNWVDIYNPRGNYGPNAFDIKFIYNLGLTYRPDFFKSKKGWMGHLLHGWSVSPFFAATSGAPTRINWSGAGGCGADCQAFGQTGNPSGGASGVESAIPILPFNTTSRANRGVTGSNGIGTNNTEGINLFADPATVFNNFRRCVLGIDTSCGGGVGNLRGLPRWNVDATLAKEFKITERVGLQFTMQVTNVLNHFQPNDPRDNSANNLRLNQPTNFGKITDAVYDPRQIEWGMRIHF